MAERAKRASLSAPGVKRQTISERMDVLSAATEAELSGYVRKAKLPIVYPSKRHLVRAILRHEYPDQAEAYLESLDKPKPEPKQRVRPSEDA